MKSTKKPTVRGASTKPATFRLSHECLDLLASMAQEEGRGTGRSASKTVIIEKAVRHYAARRR